VGGECDEWSIEDAVDTVRFQFMLLDFVVIMTIPLMAEEVVLEAVDVRYVYLSSWFEFVKLVRHPGRGTE